MIPDFDDNGYLPPGIHRASLAEIAERFGVETEIRRAEMQSLRWVVELARRAGAARIVVNGSFVTDVKDPNDVDCVLLAEPGFPTDAAAEMELRGGLPFVTLHIVGQELFDNFVSRFFATDRYWVPKGLIEVI